MRRILSLVAGMVITLAATAQTAGQVQPRNRNDNQQPRALPTVEQEAQMRVDQMAAEMPLTQKQVKKLLAYYKKDIQYRRENFPMAGGPRPDGGKRPGNNGQRGPGMGQGQPPQGNPGMGTGNGRGPGMGMGTPPSGRPEGQDIDLEKLERYNLKQDKKLRKIIGDDNFTRWRAAHPHQMPELPGFNGSNH
ncbi:MAG: hypothetical protein II841_12030 [Bacteroidales bacterium]|nr:hypothetical protein [Bacteroidales bacterium]MBR0052539.1 hypothetical protein [Bacteroidales bacterium]